jgi:type IV secretion system protein VirD4
MNSEDQLDPRTLVRRGTPAPAIRPPPNPNADRPLVIMLFVGLVLAVTAGTQYVAWRFGFHRNLGAPLVILPAHAAQLCRVAAVFATGSALTALGFPRLRVLSAPLALIAVYAAFASGGRIYAPHRFFVWYSWSTAVPAAAPIFWGGGVVIVVLAVTTFAVLTNAWRRLRRAPASRTLGSARWGSGERFHGKQGLLLGRQERRLLRFVGEGHVLTVAPTRSGKGVSAVIPNLLDHEGSVLVTDPKGENYAVTARRRRDLGQEVHAFDPFGVVAGDATYNPLDLVDASVPEGLDDARLLADMLVLPDVREGEQAFWNEEARGLLTGLILYAAAKPNPDLRTLSHVRELLTLAPEGFAALLAEMAGSPAVGGLVARAAARLLQKAEKERSGVVSTAHRHTHFLDSPRMTKVLASSSLDLSILKRGSASVYLILPTDRFDGYARWLRLMIASALLAMLRNRGQPRERVLFLLDEFAHLGRMGPVERDIGLAGGLGVTFWLVVQDLSQLRSTYFDTWPTFLANVDVLQAFGVNDWDTSDYLSKMTGEATVQVESEYHSHGLSRGSHGQYQSGAGRTRSEAARRLLLPDEVRRLAPGAQLLFPKGGAPLLVERLNYLVDKEFARMADPNPLYDPVAATLT